MIREFIKRILIGAPSPAPAASQQEETAKMAKVLVLYYSSYGHIETMAYAVAEGAKSAGADVTVKRVPELVSEEVAKASHFKTDQAAAIATPDELADYDAIIVGAGTRFGTVASQMRNFWDQTGGLWFAGKLVGKVGSVFTSSATQHGGQESTILGFIPTFLHQGMVVAGLPYAFQGQMGVDEIKGGSPYGASTITDGDGSRQPSAIELEAAKFQGAHVAKLAAKLA
jgi:NAD(P)H dehydrogenase (quinone)